MIVQEAIIQLKTQLAQTSDEQQEAELIILLLKKYDSQHGTESKLFIDRLIVLSEKLNTPRYKAWALYHLASFPASKGDDNTTVSTMQRAIHLFEKLNDSEGLADSYTKTGNVYLEKCEYPEALKSFLLALRFREAISDKRGMSACYNSIGNIYGYQGNFLEGRKSFLLALQLREEADDKIGVAQTCHNIGITYEREGNYPEALKNHLRTLNICEEIGNQKGVANAYSSSGNVYDHWGNFPEALKNHLSALRIRETINDKHGVAESYHNVGIIHFRQHNYPEALKNYFKALQIREALGNKRQIADNYEVIAAAYSSQAADPRTSPDERAQWWDEALINHLKALRIREEIGDIEGLADTYCNLGIFHLNQGNYDKAMSFFLQVSQLCQEMGDKRGIAYAYKFTGEVYAKQGDAAAATKSILHAYQISEELGKKELIKESAASLFETYKSTGDFENALKYHEKYHQIESEMLGDAAQKQLTNLGFMHNLEQKEREAAFEKEKREEADRFRKIVEIKNTEIIQSINYASKIQSAILPPLDAVKKQLPDSFVLHLSKDIVSGDFYFLEANNDYIYIAVVDCTGHGVPGAMVSIVGHAGLKRTIDEYKLNQPADILLKLNEIITATLHQSDVEDTVSDGMDIALCRLDLKKKQLMYAGANRPLWLFRRGELMEFKPAKTAIGGMKYEQDRHKQFTQEEIALLPGDTFYIFSDGYADQFGGEMGKKMMVKNLKETLRLVQNKTMAEQQNYLNNTFKAWKREYEQVDDVLVIGVRI